MSRRLERPSLVAPSLVVGALAIGVGLSAICAAVATVGGFPLLAVLVYVADKHPAFEATAGTLKAGVVCLYGVLIMVMVAIVVMGVYPICVHSPNPFCGPGSGVSLAPAGPSLYPTLTL